MAVILHEYRHNSKNITKQQKHIKTKQLQKLKVIPQTEHWKYEYNTYYKNTHTRYKIT
jgi:hypothetical protein